MLSTVMAPAAIPGVRNWRGTRHATRSGSSSRTAVCVRAQARFDTAPSRRELLLGAGLGLGAAAVLPAGALAQGSSAWDFTVQQYDKPFGMDAFKGKVLVVVNVASE